MRLTSATQINTWTECRRKYGWKYIARIPSTQSPAAALGTEIDDTQLQPYLSQGKTFDYSRPSGDVAASILAWLPPPMAPGLEVQRRVEMPSPTLDTNGSAWYGYQGAIDLWLPAGHVLPGLEDSDIPAVVDFKSTSDLKWAKSESTLRKDPQAIIYATWALYYTRAPAVDLVWLYMQTRGPRKAKRVHLRMVEDEVVQAFRAVDSIAHEMLIHRTAAEQNPNVTEAVLALPPNLTACESYGGCPYRAQCNFSPAQMVTSSYSITPKETDTMANNAASLLAQLKAKKAEVVGATAPAPVMPEPVAVTPAPVVMPGPPAGAQAALVSAPPVPPVETGPINPPEAALPPAPPAALPAATAAPAHSADEPKKRGRPAGSKNVPKESVTADVRVAVDELVTVTWGEEKIVPIPYNSCTIGPFQLSGKVRDGETTAAATLRLYAELEEMAHQMRERKLAAFAALLAESAG